MSTFSLVISCLTTSSLPWFMDLTFQLPMQYCSLQHWTLLPSPVTSTTRYCFCFGSFSSFFLELFLQWSQVAYWAPTNLGSSSFSVLSFCLFILFMGYSGRNTEVVCHSLLQWTTLHPKEVTQYELLEEDWGHVTREQQESTSQKCFRVRGLQQGVPKEPTQAPYFKNGQYLHIDYAEGYLQTRLIKFFKNVPQLLAPPHP